MMQAKQRNRGTIALSPEGFNVVKTKIYERRITQDTLAFQACVSVATVKRLLQGNRIEPSCFNSLLAALDLEVKDSYIKKKSEISELPTISVQETSISSQHPGVFMTATFIEAKRPTIERMMRHLKELLIDGEVTFLETGGAVTVSGNFSEINREHIEMTIAQLTKLFTSSKVTW